MKAVPPPEEVEGGCGKSQGGSEGGELGAGPAVDSPGLRGDTTPGESSRRGGALSRNAGEVKDSP